MAGTPYFMPREQVLNFKYVKPVSDVWSMGATLYHMLTGRFPREFPRGRRTDPFDVILETQVTPISKHLPQLPSRLARVVDKALSDSLDRRYPDAASFKAALSKCLRARE